MKITNGEGFQILMLIASLHETGKLGYALAKQRRLLETELKEFIDIRNAAITAHMEGDVMTEEGAAAANAELAEYVDLPCEVRVVTVPDSVFCCGGLTSDQMYILDFMVEVTDDE